MHLPILLRSLLLILTVLAAAPLAAMSERPSQAAVASAHPLATEAGMAILAAGGNAFDAAVAVSAALAVVEPYGSGLGGGGFWLLHRAGDGRQLMVDGRERAPGAAHRDLYLDAQGEVIDGASINGPLAAAIPGQPAALAHIAEHYGRLPLAQSLAPAIRLARDGFAVDEHYRRWVGFRTAVLARQPAAASQFLVHGAPPPLGHVLRQPDLADTLQALAERGRDGFYAGPVAQRLVDGTRAGGGIWTLQDLADYRVVEREPMVGEYHGLRVVSAALPSSGGVLLVQMLNMLSELDLAGMTPLQQRHYLVEVMRRAYRDRAVYLGDADYVAMPLARLTSPEYAHELLAGIDPARATPSTALGKSGAAEATAADPYGSGAPPALQEGRNTTHFSILDAEGNRVGATLSINYPFGACYVPPGTGVLLNDEMDDFAAKPGVPNAYGLVGAEANAIAPGKRPLSSMSPTFVEGPDGVAILGTPGGSRIISMVLLAILDIAAGRTDPAHWVRVGRIHHQYLPDRLQYEPDALDPATVAGLAAMGHQPEALDSSYGNMQAIYWDSRRQLLRAASDPRGIGAALVSSPSSLATSDRQ